jgi:PIN domain nuclease of toxin-antitoxin system
MSCCSVRRACGRLRSNAGLVGPTSRSTRGCCDAGFLDNGYAELAITSEHAVAVDLLPAIHKDPFDRILIAQSTVEGGILLTADPRVSQYPGPVRQV